MSSTGLPAAVEAVFNAVDPALAADRAGLDFAALNDAHLMDAGVGAADFLDEAVAAPSRNKDRIAVDPA